MRFFSSVQTTPVVQLSLNQQLDAALSKVNEANEKIRQHDLGHIAFVRQYSILTDDFGQASIPERADLTGQQQNEIRDRFNLFREKRCGLEQDLHRALATWAEIKQRVEQIPGFSHPTQPTVSGWHHEPSKDDRGNVTRRFL